MSEASKVIYDNVQYTADGTLTADEKKGLNDLKSKETLSDPSKLKWILSREKQLLSQDPTKNADGLKLVEEILSKIRGIEASTKNSLSSLKSLSTAKISEGGKQLKGTNDFFTTINTAQSEFQKANEELTTVSREMATLRKGDYTSIKGEAKMDRLHIQKSRLEAKIVKMSEDLNRAYITTLVNMYGLQKVKQMGTIQSPVAIMGEPLVLELNKLNGTEQGFRDAMGIGFGNKVKRGVNSAVEKIKNDPVGAGIEVVSVVVGGVAMTAAGFGTGGAGLLASGVVFHSVSTMTRGALMGTRNTANGGSFVDGVSEAYGVTSKDAQGNTIYHTSGDVLKTHAMGTATATVLPVLGVVGKGATNVVSQSLASMAEKGIAGKAAQQTLAWTTGFATEAGIFTIANTGIAMAQDWEQAGNILNSATGTEKFAESFTDNIIFIGALRTGNKFSGAHKFIAPELSRKAEAKYQELQIVQSGLVSEGISFNPTSRSFIDRTGTELIPTDPRLTKLMKLTREMSTLNLQAIAILKQNKINFREFMDGVTQSFRVPLANENGKVTITKPYSHDNSQLAKKIQRAQDRSGVPPEMVMKNAQLSPEARLKKASELLGKKLNPEQEQAILSIHEEISKGVYQNGHKELRAMVEKLDGVGISREDGRILMENGVLGSNFDLFKDIGRLLIGGGKGGFGSSDRIDSAGRGHFDYSKKLELVKENIPQCTLSNQEKLYSSKSNMVIGLELGNSPVTVFSENGNFYIQDLMGGKILIPDNGLSLGRANREYADKLGLISDGKVSREHVILRPDGRGGIIIRDNNSSRGTTIYSTTITKEVTVENKSPMADKISERIFEAPIERTNKISITKTIDGTYLNQFKFDTEASYLFNRSDVLKPKYEVEFGGYKYYLTEKFQSGREMIFGYVLDNGVLKPRFFYRSDSGGNWHACPGLRPGGYSKGEGIIGGEGINENLTYEKGTLVDSDVGIFFDSGKQIGTIPDAFNPMTLHSKKFGKVLINKDHQIANSMKQEVVVDTSLVPHGINDKTLAELKSLNYQGLQKLYRNIPIDKINFTRIEPTDQQYYHDKLKTNIKVDIMHGIMNGREVEILIATGSDRSDLHWVEDIRYKGLKKNSFMMDSEKILGGLLTTKPIEYDTQVPPDIVNAARENQKKGGNYYVGDYVDMRYFTQENPLIQQYKSMKSN